MQRPWGGTGFDKQGEQKGGQRGWKGEMGVGMGGVEMGGEVEWESGQGQSRHSLVGLAGGVYFLF